MMPIIFYSNGRIVNKKTEITSIGSSKLNRILVQNPLIRVRILQSPLKVLWVQNFPPSYFSVRNQLKSRYPKFISQQSEPNIVFHKLCKLETRLQKAKRLFLHGKNNVSQKDIYYMLNEGKYPAKIYNYRHNMTYIFSHSHPC